MQLFTLYFFSHMCYNMLRDKSLNNSKGLTL